MKELERTKRISISAVVFLLIIVIGLLTFKRPTFNYENSAVKTLDNIVLQDHIISMDEFQHMGAQDIRLVDVRSNVDYAKGHLNSALNVPINQLLTDRGTEIFNTQKPVVIYGQEPGEANAAWMLLFQLGNEQVKILSVKTLFEDNKFQWETVSPEKPEYDYAAKMKKSKQASGMVNKATPEPAPPRKTVITKPKKKKRMPEGGC